jgi:hypothetical protein
VAAGAANTAVAESNWAIRKRPDGSTSIVVEGDARAFRRGDQVVVAAAPKGSATSRQWYVSNPVTVDNHRHWSAKVVLPGASPRSYDVRATTLRLANPGN